MECPKCQKEYDDEFFYCPYCGTKTPQPKICGNCGLETRPEFSFCPLCGSKLEGNIYDEFEKLKNKLEEVKIYLNKDPSNRELWVLAADLLVELNNPKEAIICYERALELQPSMYVLNKIKSLTS